MSDIDSSKTDQVLQRGVTEVLPHPITLRELMLQRPIRVYLGIDPTGSLLHLGHAVALRKLQQFADLGHQAILLVGNGTVRIGDPTGRDESRPMLDDETIRANFQAWQKQASKILDFSKIEIRYNGDWLDKLDYAAIVKLLAKTTIQQLIERDMFQKRLQDGLPIHGHEIIYPLLQGYDSVAMDVDLEIGGNDQTFNMMMGRHLQQQYNHKEKWVLTTPLIEGTDGRKMSKSYNNYVSLTENPRDMYGKLMRIKDELIGKYFSLLTDVTNEEIENMEQAIKTNSTNPMEYKKELAFTITSQLHDEAAAREAADFFNKTVQGDETPELSAFGQIIIRDGSISLDPPMSSMELSRRIEQGAAKLLPTMEKITNRQALLDLPAGAQIKLGKRDWYQIIRHD